MRVFSFDFHQLHHVAFVVVVVVNDSRLKCLLIFHAGAFAVPCEWSYLVMVPVREVLAATAACRVETVGDRAAVCPPPSERCSDDLRSNNWREDVRLDAAADAR